MRLPSILVPQIQIELNWKSFSGIICSHMSFCAAKKCQFSKFIFPKSYLKDFRGLQSTMMKAIGFAKSAVYWHLSLL